MNSIWICQSARTPKIYGKRTAAMASLSLISNWLLRFVLLSVNYFIGWQVYSFKQIMQLNFICPTNREIESKGVYYYMVRGRDLPEYEYLQTCNTWGTVRKTHHSSHRPIMSSKSVKTSHQNYFCISVHVSHVRNLHEIEILYSTMVHDCGSLLFKLTNIYLKTVKNADKRNFLSFKVQSLRFSGSSKLSESYLFPLALC